MNSDYAVFIGRFEPFHKGHEAVLRKALANARHVVVLVGSAHRARSPKNPFTWQERSQMIRSCLSDADNTRVTIRPIQDYLYSVFITRPRS